MCFRLKVEFAGDWRVAWVRKIFLCFYTLSRKFCCFLGHPVGFFIKFETFSCFTNSTKPVHRRDLFVIKLIKSDSYFVIGVSGRPQNFYCDLYLVRGISTAFSRVLLAFHYSFFILLSFHKV
ncbi:hypothetical protein PUN28_005650 [Cardiocondyla obscurior]|uniref:Uncharacterized protein n=1 Tax=Cardiocondyla obscurior TaxID=286306 RepID=A0AAW2G6I9_9HYME